MTLSPQRWRALILSVALSAVAYLAFSVWGGWQDVTAAVSRVGWAGAVTMLALSALNYALRFVRWQIYLSVLGQRVPWRESLTIYLSGFALTTTPGKAGEAFRSVFLKPLGISYSRSMAAFLSERLSDLIAVVLLACLGLARHPSAWPLVVAGAVAVCSLSALLGHPRWLPALDARLGSHGGSRLRQLLHKVVRLLLETRQLHAPRVVLVSTVLSLAAWSSEAWAFHLMLGWLDHSAGVSFAFFTYALSMLAGALSFMPGGLGGAEATMVALLLWSGQSHAHAVASTVLIRLTTLWFAVVVGLVALVSLLRRPEHAAAGIAAPRTGS